MSIRLFSGAVLGIKAFQVDVEIDVSGGMPSFDLVGLPKGAVKESKIRVRSALKNSGFPYPLHSRRITVNLAPADIKKEGSGFDLPIAIGLLSHFQVISPSCFQDTLFVGELALSGEIKPVKGTLSMAMLAREKGLKRIIVPFENRREAAIVEGVEVYPMTSLGETIDFLEGNVSMQAFEESCFEESPSQQSITDYMDVKGQEHVKRALEIAASGNHNVLMVGPPGSGKTMLAKRLPSILPPLEFEESLETTSIFSVAGQKPMQGLLRHRPFRSPHHSISNAGLIGGGRTPRPGEISLAHHGVLFLDELPEFQKPVLENLRQPLEEGEVHLSRSMMTLTYPSRFLLVAAMNPCPCGLGGSQCRCSPQEVHRYQYKLSAPLLDRIDLHIQVPPVPFQKLSESRFSESSRTIRKRVLQARKKQKQRFEKEGILVNSEMQAAHIQRFCGLDETALSLMERAVSQFGMSARSFHRILKVARTIADLEEQEKILSHHISEAIQYRYLDRRRN